jgi:hypothetical protein
VKALSSASSMSGRASTYLEVRMPPPEVLDRVTGALGALLDSLRA